MFKKKTNWVLTSTLAIVLGLSFSSFTDEGESSDRKAYAGYCSGCQKHFVVCAVGENTCEPKLCSDDCTAN